ncbi:MAG: ABC transporter ATP-binding protein [Dehalococcoidia bacterium]|nr:ABC transporter ATP-binding protein [Dehalococcoidia bacterium]
MLEVRDLKVCCGTAVLLSQVSLNVDNGELVSLVGPNGAGKSTLLRAITGLVKWERSMMQGTRAGDITVEGTVSFDGERLDPLQPHEIARRGLVHCPERARVFPEMTVMDNLRAGAYLCRDRQEIAKNLGQVYKLFPVLKDRGDQISGTLSGGERQMLAIGRALMMRPKLLCIDEPSTGLSTRLKTELFERIREIRETGIAVLLVEQDVSSAFKLAARNYVLSHGRVIAEGCGEELLRDETMRKTYLGL